MPAAGPTQACSAPCSSCSWSPNFCRLRCANSQERGRRERDRVVRRVEVEQQFGTEAQEGDHPLVDVVLVGPGDPVVQVGVDVEVREAVGQRRRHGVGHAAVALAVAGGEDRPAFRHLVFAEAAVEDQLIGRGRYARRRRGDLVEKQDAVIAVAFGVGQDRGRCPLDEFAVAKRDAAQVARFHLRQAYVDDRRGMALAGLTDHVRLADAGRAPEHHRGVVTFAGAGEFAVEDGEQLGGTHHDSYCRCRTEG